MWRTTKGFMNWKNKSGPPNQLLINNKLVTKASEIAAEMNCFFIKKVETIREGIKNVTNTFSKCKEIMSTKTCKLNMKHVTITKVNKLIKLLKESRSISIDKLDNYCVKISADIIDKPLHHIITLSILQSKFPSIWKFSKVVPLHKKLGQLEEKKLQTSCYIVSTE